MKCRRQREIANRRKTLDKTRRRDRPRHQPDALLDRPASYAPGDRAPVLVAKGIDFLALKMRKIAKEEKIPIIENRPLARELYATVKEGEEIPDKFYRVIAEIIRYVFKIKEAKRCRQPCGRRRGCEPSPQGSRRQTANRRGENGEERNPWHGRAGRHNLRAAASNRRPAGRPRKRGGTEDAEVGQERTTSLREAEGRHLRQTGHTGQGDLDGHS